MEGIHLMKKRSQSDWLIDLAALPFVVVLCFVLLQADGMMSSADADETGVKNTAHGADPEKSVIELARKKAKEAQKNSEASAEYHFSLAQAYATDGEPDRAI